MLNKQNEKTDNYSNCDGSKVCEYFSDTIGDDALSHNNNAGSSEGGSALINFYKNSTILITGGTGFIGKALIEKLLRTCTNLSRIYVLIRPRRNQTVEERYNNLLDSSVFDRIRSENKNGKLLSKIIGIAGDITEPNLGISPKYLQTLIENVTIVFHSAATIKFNESLDTAARLNILGTQRVILLCQEMTNLKALVHVSTAYSNPDQEKIEEMVYPVPEFQRKMKQPDNILSMDLLEPIGKKMEQTHPNTYTLTKAIAELLVAEFATNIPVAIVRPSIVTAAWREPFEGWVESTSGVTAFLIGVSQGMISSLLCDRTSIVDLIPVDIVANTLVASAYYICTCSSHKLEVFNCTSGSFNPLSWEEFGSLCRQYCMTIPSKYIQWYPGFTFRTNRFFHFLHEGVCQFLPALFTDTILKLTGNKPMLLKAYEKLTALKQSTEHFTLNQWNFSSKNIRILQETLQQSSENEVFNIDPTVINWNIYMKHYFLGIRKYVFKDSENSPSSTQRKLKRLYWMQKLLQIFSIVMIYKLIFLAGKHSSFRIKNL